MKKYLFLFLFIFFVVSPAHAASVSGKIVYDGAVPKLRPINMGADPVCLSMHKDQALPQILVLGDNNTMGNVFVYVKEGLPNKKYDPPAESAVITQHGCQYHPHVLGLMVGQPLKILNPDGTLHNVHALPKKNKEFNMAMPKFRKEITTTFSKSEFMFPIKCDVHPWMGGWVAVMDNPYFTVTKADGLYTIDNLPPGTYTIAAWQEKLGERTAKVTISGADDTKQVDFTFSRPGK